MITAFSRPGRVIGALAAAVLLFLAAVLAFGYHAARWLKGDDAPRVMLSEAVPDAGAKQLAARDMLLEWSKLAFYLLGGRYSANGTGG